MVSNRITEGVGKKIVEALKKQSDIEIQNVVENPIPVVEEPQNSNNDTEIEYTTEQENEFENQQPIENQIEFEQNENIEYQNDFSNQNIQNFTQPSILTPPPIIEKEPFANDLEGFEIPTNIAVLKQLINQLPAGVSKQTGAQIIKQTMEALGISMKSVLQEAQQVQESLNNSARECQTSIMEYKKQINVLEKQSHKLQRQYAALNDIISLFIQTNI